MRLLSCAALVAVLLTQSGCLQSTVLAADWNPRVDHDAIELGMSKPELDRVLDSSGIQVGNEPGVYQYAYQHVTPSKHRLWGYFLIEFPSLSTGAALTAPIERALVYWPSQRTGVAAFDSSGGLVFFRELESNTGHFAVGGDPDPQHGHPGPYTAVLGYPPYCFLPVLTHEEECP